MAEERVIEAGVDEGETVQVPREGEELPGETWQSLRVLGPDVREEMEEGDGVAEEGNRSYL